MSKGRVEGASAEKTKGYLEQAAKAGDALSKIDKGVDALQEMGGEGVDWVTEAFTQIGSGNLWGLLP